MKISNGSRGFPLHFVPRLGYVERYNLLNCENWPSLRRIANKMKHVDLHKLVISSTVPGFKQKMFEVLDSENVVELLLRVSRDVQLRTEKLAYYDIIILQFNIKIFG